MRSPRSESPRANRCRWPPWSSSWPTGPTILWPGGWPTSPGPRRPHGPRPLAPRDARRPEPRTPPRCGRAACGRARRRPREDRRGGGRAPAGAYGDSRPRPGAVAVRPASPSWASRSTWPGTTGSSSAGGSLGRSTTWASKGYAVAYPPERAIDFAAEVPRQTRPSRLEGARLGRRIRRDRP